MKKILFLIILFLPLFVKAQPHILQGNLQFSERSIGLGMGYAYTSGDVGLFSNVSFDLSHKASHPNLETGIAADVALALRQTDESDNWAQINIGGIYQVNSGIWAVLAPGISVYQSFTQHQDEYWVHRDNYTRFNMGGGLLHTKAEKITISLMGYTSPKSVSFGIGFKFPTQKDNE